MRYDFMIIWGHGLEFKDHILDMMNQNANFEIVKIVRQQVMDMDAFVKSVYSCDYAPFEHLESKTRYLLKTLPEVFIVFFKNYDPQEDFRGEGKFKHIESKTLREFKELVRNRFNPKSNNVITEDHVVHGSDSEDQTDFMLKFLGFDKGLDYLRHQPNRFFTFPYHLPNCQSVIIKKIPFSEIYCNFFSKKNGLVTKEHLPISFSPHYRCLQGDEPAYNNYLQFFLGNELTDHYSLSKFRDLALRLQYLKNPNQMSHVVVSYDPIDKHYTVLDGLHRSAILLFRGEQFILVAVI